MDTEQDFKGEVTGGTEVADVTGVAEVAGAEVAPSEVKRETVSQLKNKFNIIL